VALLLAAALVAGPAPAAPDTVVLDWTPPATPGAAPPGWEVLRFPRVGRATEYVVVREAGEHVLRGESRGGASALLRTVDLDPRVHRRLAWRFRAERLPAAADRSRREGDDYAARVYVAFDSAAAGLWARAREQAAEWLRGRRPPGHAICYVWDTGLPVETGYDNPYSPRVKMLVVESGSARRGRWVEVQRDVLADYRRLFGAEPPRIVGLAVMTDADDTGSHALAWYGGLSLGPGD
jgi:hypothetical protein